MLSQKTVSHPAGRMATVIGLHLHEKNEGQPLQQISRFFPELNGSYIINLLSLALLDHNLISYVDYNNIEMELSANPEIQKYGSEIQAILEGQVKYVPSANQLERDIRLALEDGSVTAWENFQARYPGLYDSKILNVLITAISFKHAELDNHDWQLIEQELHLLPGLTDAVRQQIHELLEKYKVFHGKHFHSW